VDLGKRLLKIDPTVRARLIEAIELHGHLGPFLVLGMRMGLLAERLLGERAKACEVELPDNKPHLCALDGIRAVIDEDRVVLRDGDGIAATFHGENGKKITLAVKNNVIGRYVNEPFERCEENAFKILSRDDAEILDQVV